MSAALPFNITPSMLQVMTLYVGLPELRDVPVDIRNDTFREDIVYN
jgi:hypothetical protein